MSDPKTCPKCGLLNPWTAQRCDCGWDFVARRQPQSYLTPEQCQRPPAVTIGGVLLVLFIVVRLLMALR